ELREDFRGLFARGRLIPEVARGRELISLLRAGAIDGLSIGFRASKARIDPKTRIRRLHAVDLWESSIVTFPLLAGARVRAVKHATSKAKLSCGRQPPLRAGRELRGRQSPALLDWCRLRRQPGICNAGAAARWDQPSVRARKDLPRAAQLRWC
ncbi:MAG: HK97 family phage prohead protease, partial [Tardiphaga sp.]